MNAAHAADARQLCPECGATCPVGADRCWMCHARLPATGVNPFSPPAATAAEESLGGGQFSLATILLVITLIAVCLGVFRMSPGFGLAMIAFSVPALIRTFFAGAQQKRAGQRLTVADKLTAFAASMGIMVLIGIAAVIAFQIACWGTCGLIAATTPDPSSANEEALLVLSVGAGSLAALGIGGWILWLTRPRKPRTK